MPIISKLIKNKNRRERGSGLYTKSDCFDLLKKGTYDINW